MTRIMPALLMRTNEPMNEHQLKALIAITQILETALDMRLPEETRNKIIHMCITLLRNQIHE